MASSKADGWAPRHGRNDRSAGEHEPCSPLWRLKLQIAPQLQLTCAGIDWPRCLPLQVLLQSHRMVYLQDTR